MRAACRPSSAARSSEVITSAAAPSFSGQAFPAVTLPSGLKAGCSSLSFSYVEDGRGPSSASTTVPSAFVYGVSSRAKKPDCCAATARSCDCCA